MMPDWTPEREAEIRKRCESATAGPWEPREFRHGGWPPGTEGKVYRVEIAMPILHPVTGKRYASRLICQVIDYCEWLDHPANVEFICQGRQDLPDALAEIERLRAEVAEQDATFELRWNAEMRAIQRWQAATGRTMVWPDHADLCVWLMNKIEALEDCLVRNAKAAERVQNVLEEKIEQVQKDLE